MELTPLPPLKLPDKSGLDRLTGAVGVTTWFDARQYFESLVLMAMADNPQLTRERAEKDTKSALAVVFKAFASADRVDELFKLFDLPPRSVPVPVSTTPSTFELLLAHYGLQNEDAVAPGYNPQGLTVKQVGKGWRLLEENECFFEGRRSKFHQPVEVWMENDGVYSWTPFPHPNLTEFGYRVRLNQ